MLPAIGCLRAHDRHGSQLRLMEYFRWSDLDNIVTCIICLLPISVKSLIISLPGELRLAAHAPSPGWYVLLFLLSVMVTHGVYSM